MNHKTSISHNECVVWVLFEGIAWWFTDKRTPFIDQNGGNCRTFVVINDKHHFGYYLHNFITPVMYTVSCTDFNEVNICLHDISNADMFGHKRNK